MIEAHAHLAYAPRGAGLLYAVLWFGDGPSIYGWYIGSRDGVPEASYFAACKTSSSGTGFSSTTTRTAKHKRAP